MKLLQLWLKKVTSLNCLFECLFCLRASEAGVSTLACFLIRIAIPCWVQNNGELTVNVRPTYCMTIVMLTETGIKTGIKSSDNQKCGMQKITLSHFSPNITEKFN